MNRKLFSTQRAHFLAFAGFMAFVFFVGGSSRGDVQSLLLLRPMAVFFCAYALLVKPPGKWKGRMAPLWLAFALAMLIALQLVPLPPALWTLLPERQIFADIADLAGMQQPWRPLTLSPSETSNSLFSLAVPMAAMMLYLNLDRANRTRVVPVLFILSLISAGWAIAQISGPSRGPLYLYRITNFGTGVGLFANRNHQAVVLVCTIVMLGWYAGTLTHALRKSALKFYASLSAILVLVPLIFITGSRTGLVLMLPALFAALLFIYSSNHPASQKKRTAGGAPPTRFGLDYRRLTLLAGICALAALATASIMLSRSLAFERLFNDGDVDELRVQILPTLFSMLEKYMPLGSGFGTFEHVYKIYEPQDLLRSSYLNQAHNDWLQFIIEGGIPALAIGLAALVWLAARLWIVVKYHRAGSNPAKHMAIMAFTVTALLLAASVTDYPLRVPSIMCVFAVMVCIIGDAALSLKRDSRQ